MVPLVDTPSPKCSRIFKVPLAKSVVFARYSLRRINKRFSLFYAHYYIRVVVLARKIHSFRYKNTSLLTARIFRGGAHKKRRFCSLSLRGIEFSCRTAAICLFCVPILQVYCRNSKHYSIRSAYCSLRNISLICCNPRMHKSLCASHSRVSLYSLSFCNL